MCRPLILWIFHLALATLVPRWLYSFISGAGMQISIISAFLIARLLELVSGQRAIIHNSCPFSVYGFTVMEGRSPDKPDFKIQKGSNHSEPIYRPAVGAPSVKLSDVPYLVDKHGQTRIFQLEYNYADNIYYDLSAINCQPFDVCMFSKHRHKLHTSDPTCRAAHCRLNESHCRGAYLFPEDNLKLMGCRNTTADLILRLCMEYEAEDHDIGYDSDDLGPTGQTVNGYSLNEWYRCHTWHTAVEGDTCYGLHQKYNVSAEDIVKWNSGLDCQDIHVDQQYCVSRRLKEHRSFIA